ncbi:MAG: hypothetical protein JOZ77_05830 [Candidatus Eremiobacteraeota bacterium]|nr:hypothetical protein [Candidatus Eremiobacteraeota bacterium]
MHGISSSLGDRPLPEDEESIAPDIAPRRDLPLEPADAIVADRDRYGDDSANPNREDQEDVHRGTADDIV